MRLTGSKHRLAPISNVKGYDVVEVMSVGEISGVKVPASRLARDVMQLFRNGEWPRCWRALVV
jgi:hypothetical protein